MPCQGADPGGVSSAGFSPSRTLSSQEWSVKKSDAEARARALREEIAHHNNRYYNMDAPEISDAQYDALMRELQELEREFPALVTPDSPTQRVGGEAAEKFEKV